MSCDWIVDSLVALISDMNEGRVTRDIVDGYKWRIELMCSDLMAKEAISGELCTAEFSTVDLLNKAYKEMDTLLNKLLSNIKQWRRF